MIIVIGMLSLWDWCFKVLKPEASKKLIEMSGKTLFSACFSGNFKTIQWAIDLLKRHHLLQKEMNGLYKFLDFEEEISLVTLFCSMNANVECIKLLISNGFPNDARLLETKCRGKTALEYSKLYLNEEMEQQIRQLMSRRTVADRYIRPSTSRVVTRARPGSYRHQID